MNYTIFDSAGKIMSLFSSNDQTVIDLNLKNVSYIEGHYSDEYYIDNTQPVKKGNCPGPNYYFDYTTKSWQLDYNLAISQIRNQRNQLLSTVDRINPVWYASLTQAQQQELVAYRQQLLDVPQQAGFPTDIVWPAKPTWL